MTADFSKRDVAPIEVPAWLVRGIKEAQWTIYICAEPDGQECTQSTHPNIMQHKCAALREWHLNHDTRGPVVVGVPVRFDEQLLPEDWR